MPPEKFDSNKSGLGLSTTVSKNKPELHVVSPEGAIQVVTAQGEFGDKVAISGFVSNFGLFASSGQRVGLFGKGKELVALAAVPAAVLFSAAAVFFGLAIFSAAGTGNTFKTLRCTDRAERDSGACIEFVAARSRAVTLKED